MGRLEVCPGPKNHCKMIYQIVYRHIFCERLKIRNQAVLGQKPLDGKHILLANVLTKKVFQFLVSLITN